MLASGKIGFIRRRTAPRTRQRRQSLWWASRLILAFSAAPTRSPATSFSSTAASAGAAQWSYRWRKQSGHKASPPLAPQRKRRLCETGGRAAQPIFPVGQFSPRDMALFGLAMFNPTPQEQRRGAEDINRWLADGKLHVTIGRRFKLSEAASAHRLQEENTLQKAGSLTGKIVITPQRPD